MKDSTGTLSGWGRFQPADATLIVPADTGALRSIPLPARDVIARGLGRSYGDAAQRNGGTAVLTTGCDTVDWIDRSTGAVRVDAGVTIGALIDRFAPKGWFVPVTPGTRHVTIGGAIAADIHGKNHHVEGSFGDHVTGVRLRLANDDVVALSPREEPDLFWATVGGMGLTGIIVDADITLSPIPTTQVRVETQRLSSLSELVAEMQRSDVDHVFSVAWVDLLGGARSVLTQGSFAQPAHLGSPVEGSHRRPGSPHVSLPAVRLPRLAYTPAVRAFNELWWRKAPAEPTISLESITAFFHPLDAVTDWNRVYGAAGFVQWQCVVPTESVEVLMTLVDRMATLPSYFTVLKRFGPGNASPLSFPVPGWTLAVDLPATKAVLAELPALDALVAASRGRVYLAKDGRLDRELFAQMYPRLDDFVAVRRRVDPNGRFRSDLAVRLGL